MPYFEKITGDRIYLSPMDPNDAEICAKWMNDLEVSRWLGAARHTYSLLAEREWMESNAKKTDSYQFAIILREGNRLLGNIGLQDVNLIYRIATLGIFIGEEEDRSQGYGAEAIRLLVNYGFRWLGLNNINLYVNGNNARAIRCYENVGFRAYGRRRNAIFADGAWCDNVTMEVLAQDWLNA